MSIKLSFCIPTYNFGAFIGATLQSIIDQADERVQIVIVDGGSTDNTAAVVAEAATRFPRIKLIQREKRYGIDLDILETVLQADGEYCWLFSSDDILAAGALARAMRAIDDRDLDLFLMGITICDRAMRPLWDHPILDCKESQTFDWSDPRQRRDYFCRARTTTAFFSFISDIIVRRDRWLEAKAVDRFVGSCWITAAKVFAMSQKRLRVRFDPAAYVLKRGDNDSFEDRGIVGRTALSIHGFRELATNFFGPSSFEVAQVGRVLRSEYPFMGMLLLKRRVVSGRDRTQRQKFYALARRHYADAAIWGRVSYVTLRWAPVSFLNVLRPGYAKWAPIADELYARLAGLAK